MPSSPFFKTGNRSRGAGCLRVVVAALLRVVVAAPLRVAPLRVVGAGAGAELRWLAVARCWPRSVIDFWITASSCLITVW